MGFRTIKYGSIADNGASGGEVQTAATTFGELKKEEDKIALLSVGMSSLAKLEDGTKVKLTSDSQSLPEGPFTLWFVLEKNSSGHGHN